jgi:hypothetical protein
MKLTIGDIYMVTLKSGVVFFGKCEWRRDGVAYIGGEFRDFCCGMLSEAHIEKTEKFPHSHPIETQWDWLKRVGISARS